MHISSLLTIIVLLAGPVLATPAFAAKPVANGARAKPTASGVISLILMDASTQQPLRSLGSGDTIDLNTVGSALNILAETTGTVGSVTFSWDGAVITSDNNAPYALGGDDAGVLRAWTPTAGTHTLRAISSAKADGTGSPGTALEIEVVVIDSTVPTPPPPPPPAPLAVTTFILVNTTTQQDLRQLNSGDTIDLVKDGTALNIRADVSGTAGSIKLFLDGSVFNLDNAAPFAIGGDTAGSYASWTPSLGDHTVLAVPFPLANGDGSPGTSKEISFKVTNSIPTLGNWDLGTGLPLYDGNGQLNLALYDLLALSYDKSTMEMRFGPSFSDLSPNAPEDRPTLFRPTSLANPLSYIRVNPYELGTPVKDNDYWSDTGQVAYVPDVITDPGLDRIQTYAYYDHVFAISPRLDRGSSKAHPDPQTQEPYYATLFGELPKYPIAMQRNYGMQQNESLVIYRDGYLAVAGGQTSRGGTERPYPGLVFPAHKVPTAIAVTTENEFALITIWDIETHKGQLAVVALEGKYIPFHTWPYMGMPNQGSWSAFKLLGYIDLPMAMPTSVAAASNGWWSGPSQTDGKVLSQIDLTVDSNRANVYNGAWSNVVANGGYAIVASKHDNKAVAVDLSALFQYVRESYLSSSASYYATIAARGTGDANFPQAFSVRPDIAPKVVWQTSIPQPTSVLAGLKIDRWSKDFHKGYVASADGNIHIIDTSSLMWRNSWEQKHAIADIGSFYVGRNPTGMCFTRRRDGDLPLIPLASDGTQYRADPLNNLLYVAVRGDRKVVAAVTWGDQGAVYRTIQDTRMGDPVTVSTAVRGPILSVADFRGRKILSFRIGTITDNRNGQSYGAGADGTAEFELAGELPFQGYPFLVNSSNLN